MDDFELLVDGELFRIRERQQPGGALSCDVTWLSALIEGTHGFTISPIPETRERLERELRGFLRGLGVD